MNCKLGDMAVVVRSAANNEGKTVTCLEFVGKPGLVEVDGLPFRLNDGNWWRIDRKINTYICAPDGNGIVMEDVMPFCQDEKMMPIGNAGEKMERKKKETA